MSWLSNTPFNTLTTSVNNTTTIPPSLLQQPVFNHQSGESSTLDNDLDFDTDHNIINYDMIMNSYLQNLHYTRNTIRDTLYIQNQFNSQINTHLHRLGEESKNLYQLLLSNEQLTNRIVNSNTNIQNANNAHRQQNNIEFQREFQRIFTIITSQPPTQNQEMTDVVIAPRDDIILQATTTLNYETIAPENRFYERCPISYMLFEDTTPVLRIDHCGHFFDSNALLGWFRMSPICPICRHDIRTGYESNINSDQQ